MNAGEDLYRDRYLKTIGRIVNGYRFPVYIPSRIYTAYAEWICDKPVRERTDQMNQYLKLMPELYPKFNEKAMSKTRKSADTWVNNNDSNDYGRSYTVWLYNPKTLEVSHKFVRAHDAAKFLKCSFPGIKHAVKNRQIFRGYYILGHKMTSDDYCNLQSMEAKNGF